MTDENVELIESEAVAESKRLCGIVMPISTIDGCSEKHWGDVREIVDEAVENAGFVPRLVSDADDVGIIHKRIIQNLYQNPIVVCDVSAKNPNVMFELGIRLAFDRPVVIIKDDVTNYSFDTSSIEHLTYPRDLRFNKIVEFKEKLSQKIEATYTAFREDPDSTSFLKHFGEFQTVNIDSTEVTSDVAILDSVQEIKSEIRKLRLDTDIDRHRLRRNRSQHGGEAIIRLSNAIRDAAKEAGCRSKASAREHKGEIRKLVIDTFPGPSYFGSLRELDDMFQTLFDLLY